MTQFPSKFFLYCLLNYLLNLYPQLYVSTVLIQGFTMLFRFVSWVSSLGALLSKWKNIIFIKNTTIILTSFIDIEVSSLAKLPSFVFPEENYRDRWQISFSVSFTFEIKSKCCSDECNIAFSFVKTYEIGIIKKRWSIYKHK